MTPEPKAPASDLDAAVAFMERAAIMLDRGEMPVPGCQYAQNWSAAHCTVLSALSSQSQAAEGMAKALEPFRDAAEIRLCGEWRDDEKFWRTDAAQGLTFGHLRTASTALSHYRTLGGE